MGSSLSRPRPPAVALTIAGSDSGGGAGIQADLKTFHQWGVYGTSAVTAVTAQNTRGVQEVHAVPPATVAAQVRSVARDLPPAAVKTGMLAGAETVRAVAGAVREHGLGRDRLDRYVLDPVMAAGGGEPLLPPDAIGVVRDELLPLATLATPNWPEAVLLTGVEDSGVGAMERAARLLVAAGAGAALVTGGHVLGAQGERPREGDDANGEVVDVFWDGCVVRHFRGRRVPTRHTHGTGCTLSAAVAAGLARGLSLAEAVARGVEWVRRAISQAPGLGAGDGPVDHFAAPPVR